MRISRIPEIALLAISIVLYCFASSSLTESVGVWRIKGS